MSTDRLEKPRRPQPSPNTVPTASPPVRNVASATLPRRWGGSNRIVLKNNGEFKLRRNVSLADLNASSAPLYQPATNQRSSSNSTDDICVQVPAHVVKSIVISVLRQQGIHQPSEEILNAAIQEYYARNPQGVSVPTVNQY
jgi:hypothetical protein